MVNRELEPLLRGNNNSGINYWHWHQLEPVNRQRLCQFVQPFSDIKAPNSRANLICNVVSVHRDSSQGLMGGLLG